MMPNVTLSLSKCGGFVPPGLLRGRERMMQSRDMAARSNLPLRGPGGTGPGRIRTSIVVGLMVLGILSAQPITLDQAVSISLQNNYDIRIARNENKMALNNEKLAVGGLLPTASLNAAIGKSYIDSSMVMPWSFEEKSNRTSKSAAGVLSWTLFDGFKMFYAYKSLKTSASLSSYLMRDKIENTVVMTVQAYFNLVTQEALLETAKQQMDISRERLERTKTRRELGAATRVEMLNAQVAANADSSNHLAAQLNRLKAANALNILLGRSHDTGIEVEKSIEHREMKGSLEQYTSDARGHNALMTIQQKSRQLEKYNRGMARSVFLPTVVAKGSYGVSSTESDPSFFLYSNDITTASIELSATWPIFMGFRNTAAYQNSSLKLENSELSEQQYGLRLDALVYQQWETVQNAYRQVGFDETGVELAQQHLDLVKEQYEFGKAGGVEFREAQLSLLRAQVRLATAKFQARIAVTELERMAGKIGID